MKRILLIALLLVPGAPALFAQSGYDLLRQALVKEPAEGNAEAALALYARIGTEHAADRSTFALRARAG